MKKHSDISHFALSHLFGIWRLVLRTSVLVAIGVCGFFLTTKTAHAMMVVSSCISQPGGGGSWNNSASWSCGHVPSTTDPVEIAAAQAITVDVNTAAVQSITIDNGATLNGGSFVLSTSGPWLNLGTFTAGTGTVKFTSTGTGNTVSGTLNGSSSFYKVIFDGVGGSWTITDPMVVSAPNATDTLLINNGTVTVGNGTGDSLEVDGETKIAYVSGATATLQTMPGLAPGSSIIIDINNNAAPTNCPNCMVEVGYTSGTGQGNFIINKNAIVRLNSDNTTSDTYIKNESTGKVQMLGSLDYTDHASTGVTETTLTDSTRSATWTTNSEAGKYLRISSGLAKGLIYPITSNTTTTLTYTTTASVSFIETVSGTGNSRKVCSNSTSLITTNNQYIGHYLFDETSAAYLLISGSTNDDAACAGGPFDSFVVVAYPGAFTSLADDHYAHISDGLQTGDHYEIEQKSHLTAKEGTACNGTVNGAKAAYYNANGGSENIFQYTEACNLGGLSFYGVNGSNANEGVSIDHMWSHNFNVGVNYSGTSNNNSTNNKGINNSTFTGQLNGSALMINSGGGNNLIYSNTITNSGHAIYLGLYGSTTSNIISSNVINGNIGAGGDAQIYAYSGSNNNVIKSNTILVTTSGGSGIYLGSINNLVLSNTLGYTSSDVLHIGSKNIAIDNLIFSAGQFGLRVDGSDYTIANNIYNNSGVAYAVYGKGIVSINDNYGGLATNYYNIYKYGTGANLTLYKPTLAPAITSSISCFTSADGSYLVSKNDGGVAGKTKIWGGYTTPTAVAETPQSEEVDKYDYASNSWEKSASAHGYYGTGTEDPNLDYDLSSSNLSAGPYVYRATATDATHFAVYRYNSSGIEINVGTATVGSTFTDTNAGVNIKFKIDGGSPTAYIVGDQYTFVVWDASNDANTTKTVQTQRNGDTITVAPSTTISLNGDSAHHSTLSAATGSFDLINNGTVSGGNNDLTIPGNISGSGTFHMGAGSTVENRVAGAKTFGSTGGSLDWIFDTLTFSNSSATTNNTVTTAAGGSGSIKANTALNVGKATDAKTTTLDNETNDRILNLKALTITTKGALFASSTAPASVSGDFTNNGVLTANSGTINMNGVTQQTLSGAMTGSNAFYNLTLSNPSGADASDDERTGFVPGIIFAAPATATNTYAVTAPSCRVQYHSGDTYTWNNINWVGSLGRMIYFRNSATSGTWLTKVTGTQNVAYVNVSRSDASVSGGSTISADNGTNHDGTNNTNWIFGGTTHTMQMKAGTIHIGTGTVNIR